MIEKAFTRPYVVDMLVQNLCDITFYKVSDGSVRDMRCTINPQILFVNGGWRAMDFRDRPQVGPIHVFEVNKKQWRSFVLENLITITPVF